MRTWSRSLLRLLLAVLFLSPCIELITPVNAYALNAFHPVTFYENDSPSDSVNTYQTLNAPADLTLFSALSPAFAKSGSSFAGWNTAADGSGIPYSDGALYSFSADLALYAQWTAVTTVGTVTTVNQPSPPPTILVLNFSTGGAAGVLPAISFTIGSTVTLPLASTLSYPGFTFEGWFTSATGGQVLGEGGSTLTPSISETAFAQWVATPPAILSFSPNLGTGTIAEDSGVNGTTVTVPGSKGMVRSGFVFSGWNTAANDSGTNYLIGSQFTLSGTSTLYAQWSKVSSTASETVLIGSVGPFPSDSTQLSNVLRAQIRVVAAKIRSKKFATLSLFGYDSGPGSRALHMTLSTQRAVRVIEYLRAQLARFGVPRIKMLVRGEGEISGFTAAMFRRVEIFAN